MSNKKVLLHQLFSDFLQYCEIVRNLSPATTRKYNYRLERFIDWLAASLPNKNEFTLKDLTLEVIRNFRVFLNQKELKESTRYNYLVTIRSFLKYLIKQDYDSVEPEKVELGRLIPARSLKFLNSDQLEQLLNQPNVNGIIGLRDRAILELLFSTGLRVSELTNLDRDQIDFKRNEFSVIGKGRRRRVVFLSGEANAWIQKYLLKREDNYIPLFLHYSGPHNEVLVDGEPVRGTKSYRAPKTNAILKDNSQPISKLDEIQLTDPDGERFRLSVRSVQRMVKKYAKAAGVSVDVTPHVLRHSFATDLLMAGADLRTVQESLGHKNVSTTQIYTHVTNLQLKLAHEKFHGKWRKGKE